MKPWLILKAAAVLASFAYAFVAPEAIGSAESVDPPVLVTLAVATSIAVVVAVGLGSLAGRSAEPWQPPRWHSHPFRSSQPLQFPHFCSFFLLAGGVGASLRHTLRGSGLGSEAFPILAGGIGILLGVYVSTVVYRRKMHVA